MTGDIVGEKKNFFDFAQFSIEFLENIRLNPSVHAAVVRATRLELSCNNADFWIF